MSAKSLLSRLGHDVLNVFKKATGVAVDVEPIIDTAFPAIASLYNIAVASATHAEALGEAAAAANPSATNAQKQAAVISAITPEVTSVAAKLGVSTPAQSEIANYVNAVVASLNLFGAPATPAAPAAPAASATPKAL